MVTLTKRHAAFAGIVAVSMILYWKTLSELARYAYADESYSHIVVIPLISLFLLYTERKRIFAKTYSSPGPGISLALVGVLGSWMLARFELAGNEKNVLFGATLSILFLWTGGFLACYGVRAMRAAAFPLLFLLLMVPLPDSILARTIALLQRGSTDVAYLAIKSVGVPVLRQGLFLSLPGLSIEVATECSGIRSSMALLITCLLAAHYFLRTPWKMMLFVALAFPLAIVKNGIRIATLAILSVYVNPDFIRGSLHRDGGFVFFFLMLAVLWPLLIFLHRSENHRKAAGAIPPGKSASQFAGG